MDAIATHLGELPNGAGAAARQEILAIREIFQSSASSHQAFITAVEVQDTLERFAHTSREHTSAMIGHLRDIADLVAEQARLGSAQQAAIERIQAEIAAVDSAPQWEHARQHCLRHMSILQNQILRYGEQCAELSGKLRDRALVLEESLPPVKPPPAPGRARAIDAATGLPSASEAEVSLDGAIVAGQGVAVFYVHRMDKINARLGPLIADRILSACGQHVAENLLQPGDQLFRWHGPSFLALVQGGACRKELQDSFQRALAVPLRRHVETPSRTAFVTAHVGALVAPEAGPAEVRQWIEMALLRLAAQPPAE